MDHRRGHPAAADRSQRLGVQGRSGETRRPNEVLARIASLSGATARCSDPVSPDPHEGASSDRIIDGVDRCRRFILDGDPGQMV